MLNFSQFREKALPQNLRLKHLLIFTSFIGISLLVHYIAYKFSGFYAVGIILFVITLLSLCGITLFIRHFLNQLKNNDANKKTLLLLSHDDELAGQLRFLLPPKNILLEWVRTYENAITILSKKTVYIFIIDTDNKPKNTATLVELCRSHENNAHRLPIIAIQKDATTEKKCQLLLEGFDDCLPKPVKQRDIDDFYRRWIDSKNHITPNTQEKKEIEITPTKKQISTQTPNTHENITNAVNKKQALIQSHQSYDLAKDMLTMLIAMVKDNKETLEKLYEEKRWDELEELTHKIKGGCYCSGVPDLQHAVGTINTALEKGQREQLSQLFDNMTREIERLIKWDQEYDIELIFSE